MKQGKLDGSHRLTDSLLTSRHPYYTGTLRPDLLGVSAMCYLSQNWVGEADSLGSLFLSLPPVEDLRRDARNCYNMVWSLEFGEMDADTLVHLAERAVRSCAKAGDGMLLKGVSRLSCVSAPVLPRFHSYGRVDRHAASAAVEQ